MNAVQRVEIWGKTHPLWLDFLRVGLGLTLFLTGLFFLGNTETLLSILNTNFRGWGAFALTHYIAFAHLVGGILIMLGLLTRLSIIIQLPILIGAVFFASADAGVYSIYSNAIFSIVILMVAILFLFVDTGPHSLDEYYKKHKHL